MQASVLIDTCVPLSWGNYSMCDARLRCQCQHSCKPINYRHNCRTTEIHTYKPFGPCFHQGKEIKNHTEKYSLSWIATHLKPLIAFILIALFANFSGHNIPFPVQELIPWWLKHRSGKSSSSMIFLSEGCICQSCLRVLSGALTETPTWASSKQIQFYYLPCNSRDRRGRIKGTLGRRVATWQCNSLSIPSLQWIFLRRGL